MKLWQKNYKLDNQIEKFTVGNDYLLDQKLVKYDCIASIAHTRMLRKIGILTKKETNQAIATLNEIMRLNKKGKFTIKKENEDCHTEIENYLTKKLGKTGKKIHTARSRNDQVLTALRLYYKEEIKIIIQLSDSLMEEMRIFGKKYGKTKMPGYTHMRKAMPSSVSLWILSFIDSMKDNQKMIYCTEELLNQSPLGSGAGYGLPLKIDRVFTAKLLGFKKVQNNPLYVQNSRGKFESSLLHSLNQIMFDLNKISSDILFFSIEGLNFFELNSEICTGSSIMPHKKNPDVLEILRAKYHENLAHEFQIKTMIANLISGYNRDLQLTKEPTIKGIENTKECLEIMKLVLKNIKVDKEDCQKSITEEMHSVEKIYKSVREGNPFRDAYKKFSSTIQLKPLKTI